MAGWTDTLARLFSQKVIIKRLPGNRIKTIDYSKVQSVGSANMAAYKRVHRGGGRSIARQFSTTADIEQIEALRQQLYIDYTIMDSDPILCAALDIYSDECTARNPQGSILSIKSSNPQIKKILYNLFNDVLNIEFNLWSWVRTTCKFGDFMLYLEVEPTVGVINVIPIHPGFLRRNDSAVDESGNEVTEFVYEGPSGGRANNKFKMHEIAHFRLLTDTDFIPYGKSLLDGARKVFKQLILMEDAMILHRIMRAPERRVFKIDVGGLPPDSIDGYIEKIANEMKKVPFMNDDGTYNLRYNLMNMLEDYYLPVRNGESGTAIEPLDGMSNDGAIEDIEYLRTKMMAYLKIPKSFLGYDSAGDVKTSLASEDVRFARTTERIQKIFNSELAKIALVHLIVQGFTGEDLLDFELTLSPPSMIYERQKVDLLNEKVNLVQNIRDNKLWSRKRIYEELFNMDHDEWQAEVDQIAEDLQTDFRFKQIEEEGNDPKKTKKSFGTPHDIASMHMASSIDKDNVKQLYADDDRENNPGRPEKQGSYGRHKDPSLGLDPFGEKEAYRSTTAHESLIKSIKQDVKGISKLFEEKAEPFDSIEMLNENKI